MATYLTRNGKQIVDGLDGLGNPGLFVDDLRIASLDHARSIITPNGTLLNFAVTASRGTTGIQVYKLCSDGRFKATWRELWKPLEMESLLEKRAFLLDQIGYYERLLNGHGGLKRKDNRKAKSQRNKTAHPFEQQSLEMARRRLDSVDRAISELLQTRSYLE